RMLEIDSFDFNQGEISLSVFGRPHLTGNRVAGSKIEFPDLRWGYINVVRSGQIVVIRSSEKSESIRERFQNAFTENETTLFSLCLQDLEYQFLLSHSGGALDVQVLGDLGQSGDVHFL